MCITQYIYYCLLLDPAAESATHSEAGQILDRDGPPRHTKSMSLKYEPASEPLHISVK